MRLSLSNGTRFELQKYESKMVDYNGDKTQAIILYLNGTNIEAVKSAFGSEANLDTVFVYSDAGERIDFPGYQVRKSIAFGGADDEFEVTLVRGTDVSHKVAALTADVKSALATFEQAISVFGEMKNAVEGYVQAASNVSNASASALEKATRAEEYAAEMASALREREGVINSFGTNVQATAEALKKVLTELEATRTEYATLQTTLTDTNKKISRIDGISEKMDADFKNRIEKMDSILVEVRNIRTSVDETNTGVDNTNTNVNKFTNNINEFTQNINSFSKNIDEMNVTVNEANTAAAEAKSVADGLESRIVALEPVTDVAQMSLVDARKYMIRQSKVALAEYLDTHPVYYTHKGTVSAFSCTSEKQGYLQAMILTTSMALQAGVPYQPSWNAVGEPCSYDWTLEELQGLAMLIESAVRPRVSIQQEYEKKIEVAPNVEVLAAMIFNYDDISGHIPPVPEGPPTPVTPVVPEIPATITEGTQTVVTEETQTDTTDLPTPPDIEIADRQ